MIQLNHIEILIPQARSLIFFVEEFLPNEPKGIVILRQNHTDKLPEFLDEQRLPAPIRIFHFGCHLTDIYTFKLDYDETYFLSIENGKIEIKKVPALG